MQNLKKLIKEFRELKEKSTPVNYWYEHHYEAQIRGPYNRWMQFTNETELRNPDGRVLRASAIDDIKFIAHAVNNLPKLLDAMEVLVEGLEEYKKIPLNVKRPDLGENVVLSYYVAEDALQLAEEKVSGEDL